MYHNPVLLHASIDGLNILDGGTYVDVTFGGGGHSKALLEALKGGRLLAFDQDPDAEANRPDDARLEFIPQNFRFTKNFLKLYRALPVDGLLADLGVSSHQFDQAERGFSYRFDAPLDLRMNRQQGQTAAEILQSYTEAQLADMFFFYGELRSSRRIASTIVKARLERPLHTTAELKALLSPLTPPALEHKFLAQVFQALRIEVNQELQALEALLEQLPEIVRPGGRIVFISYHSLEDRLVKNFIRSGNTKGVLQKDFFGNLLRPFVEINRKAMIPDQAEILENNRARSARLRIAERSHE